MTTNDTVDRYRPFLRTPSRCEFDTLILLYKTELPCPTCCHDYVMVLMYIKSPCSPGTQVNYHPNPLLAYRVPVRYDFHFTSDHSLYLCTRLAQAGRHHP